MKITKSIQGTTYTIAPSGCLDTASTADFEECIAAMPDGTAKVLFDFSALEFISSSALRAMVSMKKKNPGLEIAIAGMNEMVKDVFEVTGLNEVFAIQ